MTWPCHSDADVVPANRYGLARVSLERSSVAVNNAQVRYLMEAKAIRHAMEPLELIKRVKEIQQEAYKEPETLIQHKAAKMTAAVGLSKRLQDLRALNGANSKKDSKRTWL